MPEAKSSRRLAALLRDRKEDLVRRWTERVLDDPEVPEANRLSEPELRDHIPRLVERLARSIEASEGGEATGRAMPGAEASEHGRDRFAKEYRLTEALSELSHFRLAILDLVAEQGLALDGDTARCLHAAIDKSMISGSDEMERAAVEQARESARFRERFIGILGHDLRNPLQSITMTAALLMRGGTTESPSQLAHRVMVSADRMGRMIADVLDVTRARLGGGVPIERKQADLGAVARQVTDELRIAHPSRTITLDAHGDVSGQWDPDRMAQAMSNVIGNALDYGPPDTPVRIVLRGEAAHVLISVNNQGPTIAPEVMAHLFEPFVQGPQGGRVTEGQGLGLGLFITQQIVEGHRGAIDVASTPEEGTTFTMRVPR